MPTGYKNLIATLLQSRAPDELLIPRVGVERRQQWIGIEPDDGPVLLEGALHHRERPLAITESHVADGERQVHATLSPLVLVLKRLKKLERLRALSELGMR